MLHVSSEMLALGLLAGLLLAFATLPDEPAEPASEAIRRCLLLPPGPGNPRNSEGDLLRLEDGTLLFCWTRFKSGRGSDHDPASLAMVVSRDDGASWSEPREVVHASDGMNVMSVTLRGLGHERIALFYLHKRSLLDCRPVVRFSEDAGATWGEPVQIVPEDDVGYDVLNNDRVLIDRQGAMIVPIARHAGVGVGDSFQPNGRLRCHRSEDGGKTWRTGAWAPDAGSVILQEPGLFECMDGSIRMFARTDAGRQFIMTSRDGGRTFTAPLPWTLRSPLSPATIERLPSGELLAIWNEPADRESGGNAPRTPLVAARSSDEGTTWGEPIVLFDHANGWYCYVALLVEGERMFLATCAGDRSTGNGLETTAVLISPMPPTHEAGTERQ
jgi:hypothetical protein